ncbi:MAG: exo-alpha-sialidase [Lentisphaerae bacterium]|nr:exo-alpha-sialidase [Lentisphaerota bacterium]
MKIVDRGTVFFGEAGSEYSSSAFPGVCALPTGRWLVWFRAARRKKDALPQRLLVTWSDDDGRTWVKPIEPFRRKVLNGVPGGWRAGHTTPLGGARALAVLYWVDESNPALPFFNETTEGLLDSRIFLALSNDNGATWSEPQFIDTAPFNMPVAITGPILLMPNGEWALQFETNKPYYDRSMWRHASVMMFSRDQGQTWPEYVQVAADPDARIFYWDQRPSVCRDGSVMDVFWTFDRKRAIYLNIHARLSRNNGRTWPALWDTGLSGQPGPCLSLADGRLAMPYVDREGPTVIKLRCSEDGGRSWPAESEVMLDDTLTRKQQFSKRGMRDAWTEMGKFSVGLPASALLPTGDVLVVYYAGSESDHTGIHWVRIEP